MSLPGLGQRSVCELNCIIGELHRGQSKSPCLCMSSVLRVEAVDGRVPYIEAGQYNGIEPPSGRRKPEESQRGTSGKPETHHLHVAQQCLT